MDDLDELKDKLTTGARILRWELADMWGHISCRSPGGNSFLILPLRPPYDHTLSEDELLEYDLEGKLISGRRDPHAEIFFFTALYKSKTDTGAVIHCHPPAAVSLVATGKKIVPIYQHAIKFGKGVPISPWLYGTWRKDGERAAKAMGKSRALMMKGHGANVIGKSIQEACLNAVHLERSAKMILRAACVDRFSSLTTIAMKKFQAVEGERSNRPGPPRSPEWNYYESMINRGERWNTL